MKTLAMMSMMAVLVTACDKGDAVAPSENLPLGIGIAFHIVDSRTGEDLFLHNDIYDVDAIKVYKNQMRDVPWRDSIRHEQRGDSTILILSNTIINEKDSTAYLLRLTPSDYDTVSVYTEAAIEYDRTRSSPITALEKLRVYYNGQFIEERDLTENYDLLVKTIGGEVVNTFYKEVKKEE